MIVDTHAHIADVKFDSDRDDVIQRAFNSGVGKLIEVSCEMCYWDKSLELLKQDNIFASFGIHPIDVLKAVKSDYEKLESLICNEKCIAVGEIGLDYHYDNSKKNIDAQKKSLEIQFNLARKYNKPVIIHCRGAYDDMIVFLKKQSNIPKGVIHCFSGNLAQAKIFVGLGFYLGIDGPITYKKSDVLKEVVKNIKISKLLVETDCPYLTPQQYRGSRNEPAYVVEVVKEIANIKGMDLKRVGETTTQNALDLFKEIK
ncbi:MAG: TatD family hydrolase [Endomicrobium sp.]|jgi:TatD DNase family protein|nr:TatD family hydrolase [Endomicrobium sp.]